MLKRAIQCFKQQTYTNKELIILYRGNDHDTVEYLKRIDDINIKPFSIPASLHLTLGDRRNLAIEKASGEYFCQWDDDDWYHNQRIEQQIRGMLDCGKEASALAHILMHDTMANRTYFSFQRPWENTVMCSRSIINEEVRYESINQQEDTRFVADLMLRNKLCLVNSFPTYIYIFHGNNTWAEPHFQMLFSNSQALDDDACNLISRIVRGTFDIESASNKISDREFLNKLNYFCHLRQGK